jgi:hypothetical protein
MFKTDRDRTVKNNSLESLALLAIPPYATLRISLQQRDTSGARSRGFGAVKI